MSDKRDQRKEIDLHDIDWKRLLRQGPLLLWGFPVLLLVSLAYTSVYTVQAESQGVVLRFGKFVKTVDPGLRFKLPFGVDRVSIVPVKRQTKSPAGLPASAL